MKHEKDKAIVYIITHLALGGAQKVCLALFNGLKEQGLPTYLITGKEGELTTLLVPSANTLIIDSLCRAIHLKSLWHETKTFFIIIKHLKRLKKKHKNIIVHTHCTKAGIIGRWAAFFAGIKTRMHTIHGFAFHEHQSLIPWFLMYSIELITSIITTHFICVSSADVKTGIRLFPRFSEKHSIIRAAVAWDQFYIPTRQSTPFPQEQPFIFGTVACFKKQKNMFDLLQAFAATYEKYPQARLEIIGDGILRTALETWIAHYNLHAVITLHGWQHHVAPLMMQWHAFILTSLWEGLPCAVVEARLLRLPVLAYNTGGIYEVIASGKNGFLYPQKEWRQLACGMQELIASPHLYHSFQKYHDNLSDFNTKTMIRDHQKLYRNHRNP